MNYASKILGYLAEGERNGQILLVAGAPAVEKQGDQVKIVFSAVLTPEDVRDTLLSFNSHVRRSSAAELAGAGVFSFGMPKMGRFRVHFMTQRGSMLVSISRMPFDIPSLEQVMADPAQAALARGLVTHPDGGLMMLTGENPSSLVEMAYVLLSHVNDTRGTAICICEQNLTYALRHKNSVVVQVELGTDAPSLEAALQGLRFIHPGILYVRECRNKSDFAALVTAAESGSLVLLSIVAHETRSLLSNIKVNLQEEFMQFQHHLLGVVGVTQDAAGKFRLSPLPGSPAA